LPTGWSDTWIGERLTWFDGETSPHPDRPHAWARATGPAWSPSRCARASAA